MEIRVLHEMSIALNVVEIGITTANANAAKKINEIVVEIGKLAGVVPDALHFCYESACKGTIAEGSRLTLVSIPARAHCSHCDRYFEAGTFVSPCPDCGEMSFEIQGGRDLKVMSINVD